MAQRKIGEYWVNESWESMSHSRLHIMRKVSEISSIFIAHAPTVYHPEHESYRTTKIEYQAIVGTLNKE